MPKKALLLPRKYVSILVDPGNNLTTCISLFAWLLRRSEPHMLPTLGYSEGSYLNFLTLISHFLSPDMHFNKLSPILLRLRCEK